MCAEENLRIILFSAFAENTMYRKLNLGKCGLIEYKSDSLTILHWNCGAKLWNKKR